VEALRVDIFAKLSDVLFPLLETVSEQPGWTLAYLKLLKFQLIHGTQAINDPSHTSVTRYLILTQTCIISVKWYWY